MHCLDNLVEKWSLESALLFQEGEAWSIVWVLIWCKLENSLVLIRLIETWRWVLKFSQPFCVRCFDLKPYVYFELTKSKLVDVLFDVSSA